jgi:hypothetical protein
MPAEFTEQTLIVRILHAAIAQVIRQLRVQGFGFGLELPYARRHGVHTTGPARPATAP